VGILCGKSRQNWFIGIRSPWTLSSERVWEKTHALAKKVYILMGVLWMVFGILLPQMIWLPIGIVILASIGLFAYSYFEYQKEEGKRSGGKTKTGEVSAGGVFPFAGRVPPESVMPAKKKPVRRKPAKAGKPKQKARRKGR
jgi:hypothetical protein